MKYRYQMQLKTDEHRFGAEYGPEDLSVFLFEDIAKKNTTIDQNHRGYQRAEFAISWGYEAVERFLPAPIVDHPRD